MEEYIWKIHHKPSGLFYCSRKGRFNDDVTNLSAKGNFYTSEKVVNKVFNEDCKRGAINEAQTKRYNLPINDCYYFNGMKIEDLEILKYELKIVENDETE